MLDLHCDSEAALHLYTLTPLAGIGEELSAELGCRALLLADVSGDDPFDEAVTRPWVDVAAAAGGRPVPLACFSCTVELRGTSRRQRRVRAQRRRRPGALPAPPRA